jgi:acyl-coenzyme A thioesterase PaaI-like protein
MMQPHELLAKAKDSAFYRWVLNLVLARMIPFNAPHRVNIEEIKVDGLIISLPYIRKNLNHLKGLHACALAALSEYTCGLELVRNFPATKYRLIMKELKMTYHYQGKMSAKATFTVNNEVIAAIKSELEKSGAVFRTFQIETHDVKGNHLCTAEVMWQLKKWEKVTSE